MEHTTKTEHRWTLDKDEQFSWVKGSFAHEGHSFTVTEIGLDLRGDDSTVLLHGPWENGYAPDNGRGGWDYLYASVPTDAARIRDLPLEVREALAGAGLVIPPVEL